ncbi:hypothetical protein D1007_59248 [Hordeum vulgare]|nr:hypothetical protein D1007_59248 [Hordeum vulgare]
MQGDDGTNKAWTGEKRRRKHLPPSPATAHDHAADMEDAIQGHQGSISHATDMELLLRTDSAEGERYGPDVLISEEGHGDMEDTIQGGQDRFLMRQIWRAPSKGGKIRFLMRQTWRTPSKRAKIMIFC